MKLSSSGLAAALALVLLAHSAAAVVLPVNVTFEPLPAANYTPTKSLESVNELNNAGLRGSVNFARSMVRTAVGTFSMTFVQQQIQAEQNGNGVDSDAVKDEAISFFTPAAIVIGLGVVCAIIVPIVGLFFCCCRCCGNCGARPLQKNNTRKCRNWLIFFLLVSILFVFAGMVLAFVSNKRFSQSLDVASEAGHNGVDNVGIFLNNTIAEAEQLINNFDAYVDEARNLINLVDDQVGALVQDDIAPTVYSMLDVLVQMDQSINATYTLVDEVHTELDDILSQASAINETLAWMQSATNDMITACQALTSPPPDCAIVAASVFGQAFDFSSITDLSIELAAMTAVYDQHINQFISTANSSFNDLATDVQDQIDVYRTDAIQAIDDISATIHDNIDDARDTVNTVITDQVDAPARHESIDDAMDTAETYDKYRYQGGVALCCMILIVVVLASIGLLMGVLSNDAAALPCDRSGTSNAAGNFLMASVVFAFIFIFFMFLFAAIGFLLSSGVHTVCDPITEGTIYSQVLDVDSTWSNSEHPLCKLANISTVPCPLTFAGVLHACEHNEAAYTALHLSSLIDIQELTDVDSYFNISDFSASVNIDNIVIFDQATEDLLLDFANSGLVQVDYELYENMVANPGLSFNPTTVTNDLDQLQSELNPVVPEELAVSNMIDAIKANITAVNAMASNLQTSITTYDLATDLSSLNETASNLTVAVTAAIDIAEVTVNDLTSTFQTFINNTVGDLIDTATFLIHDFRDNAVDQIENVIGGCAPAYAVYDAVMSATCDYALATMDGFMFAMGLCSTFSIPLIIFAVRLAKYFRKMDSQYYVNAPHRDDYDIGMVTTSVSITSHAAPSSYNNDFLYSNSSDQDYNSSSSEKPPAYY
ncbi:hypothetical protein CAOG_04143 [Capsaspora owczarzaki ATCC 30864]|uniref:Prominin n=1 Tax=Capsaspora owczarzaki (strain ATCC 30864) TaxID=595528 RepID=A0A0D2WQP9_CAPO3|nr:hypothetical protein CAOG_04143 [Capsaspora owczarzaki ATCC 30864]KJE93338.1 hypothetical protein CAOG_004143 [Capsaspora owczarzaki ATCC 30864]|eukprot:XP_004347968.1 hypothetical protein CAOG_04143 [Capsaspora owczarzaki ATCC 30864]